MSFETFTRIIDQLHPYVKHVSLFYLGEPLLCEHLDLMIRYAHHHRMRTLVSSNLNNLDEKMAERLIDSGLDDLVVSLDGASQESYEKYRIGGKFDQVVDNIKLLVKKKKEKRSSTPGIQIQYILFNHTKSGISKAKELAKSLGVDIFFREGALGGKGQSPPQMKDYELAKLWLDPEVQKQYDYFSKKPYIQEGVCPYLWKAATINWNGSVFPCCWIYEETHSFGNILEQNFKTIWNNERIRSSRSLFGRKRRGSSIPAGNTKETICYQCKMFKHIFNG